MKRILLRYLGAALAGAGAAWLRIALVHVMGTSAPYTLLFAVIVVVAVSLGTGPGLLAAAIGIWSGETFLFEFSGAWHLTWAIALRILFILAGTLYVGYVGHRLRQATQKARSDSAALRVSEERLRMAQQAAKIGAFERNIRTGVNRWEPALEAMYGLDPGEFGRTQLAWEELVHPEDRGHATALVDRTFATGEPVEGEWRTIWRDGSVHWVMGRFQCLKDASGQPLRLIGVNIDITDRKNAEAELSESEGRYRVLFDSIDQGFCTVEVLFDEDENPVDYRFLIVNPAFEKQTGIRNAAGRRMREIAPLNEEHWFHTYGRIALTGEPMRFENVAGQLHRHYEVYAWRVGRPSERKVAILFNDISERKRSEEELREAVARYERQVRLFDGVASTTPDFVYIFDLKGRFLYANRRLLEVWGMNLPDVIGRTCRELGYEQWHHDMHMREIAQVIETKAPIKGEVPFRAPVTGIFGIYEYIFTPVIDPDGKVEFIAGTSRDVSDRKQAEEALRNHNVLLEQKVQERTAELAQRAAQLRALAGELTISEQRERQRLARVLHDHLQQLLVSAKFRLAVLGRHMDPVVQQATGEIEQLLDETILSSRSLTAELSPPILHEGGLTAGLEWLARWMADKHGLMVELSADKALPALSDPVKVLMFESVRELLFNAVKHAHAGSASVNVRRIEDHHLRITVTDSGLGFDPSKLRNIGKGESGFGLFSIRERIDLIGGRLDVNSAPGKGSRFVLTVPLNAHIELQPVPATVVGQTLERQPIPVTSPLPGGSIRVLLADDHAVMREGLARLLGQESDIEIVAEAGDGEEAVEMATSLLPDVVLMDLSMPKLNGIEATRAICSRRLDIRIIGLSMFEEAERAQAIRDAGAIDYISKSGPSARLIDAIRNCKARRQDPGQSGQSSSM